MSAALWGDRALLSASALPLHGPTERLATPPRAVWRRLCACDRNNPALPLHGAEGAIGDAAARGMAPAMRMRSQQPRDATAPEPRVRMATTRGWYYAGDAPLGNLHERVLAPWRGDEHWVSERARVYRVFMTRFSEPTSPPILPTGTTNFLAASPIWFLRASDRRFYRTA